MRSREMLGSEMRSLENSQIKAFVAGLQPEEKEIVIELGNEALTKMLEIADPMKVFFAGLHAVFEAFGGAGFSAHEETLQGGDHVHPHSAG